VIAGKGARGFVVQDEPVSGVFAAELVAFAPEGFDFAGVAGFAFVKGEGGDDDGARGCFDQAAAAVGDDLRAFEGVHPILGGEEGEGLVTGGVVERLEGVWLQGSVGRIGVMVAAAEGEGVGEAPRPTGKGDGLRKKTRRAESVEQVAGDGGKIGGKSFRELKPIAAPVEIRKEKDSHECLSTAWRVEFEVSRNNGLQQPFSVEVVENFAAAGFVPMIKSDRDFAICFFNDLDPRSVDFDYSASCFDGRQKFI